MFRIVGWLAYSHMTAIWSLCVVHLVVSWLFRNVFLRHILERHRRILKTVLSSKFTMYNDYRADFWEMSTCATFESDTEEFSKQCSLLNLLCIMTKELTFEKCLPAPLSSVTPKPVSPEILKTVPEFPKQCSLLNSPCIMTIELTFEKNLPAPISWATTTPFQGKTSQKLTV